MISGSRRFESFLPPGALIPPPWTSRSLDKPALFTAVTYQALHTAYREEEEEDEEEAGGTPTGKEIESVVSKFRLADIGVLILDEAHHLRQEWWKALSKIVDGLPGVTVVSLTATPPYDVIGREWLRYEELCGPIDEEISVPELVKAGTLCPHQDFVYDVEPAPEDMTSVREYEAEVRRTIDELSRDPEFLAAIVRHPWITRPKAEEVLDDPEFAVALLVYLKHRGEKGPAELLALLDVRASEIPDPSRRWWQVLVEKYLFHASFPNTDHRKALTARLRESRILWRRELRLEKSRAVKTALSLTASKIDACREINRLESELRGDALRQVVLTDFIRDESFGRPENRKPQLGAWPIFRALAGERTALVTGRLSVVHRDRIPELRAAAGRTLDEKPVPDLPGFVRVSGMPLVSAMTQLLESGRIRVLVGTRALLGEGWDAPCVNSLILASYVGSFMLTNQMRGRAIRVDKAVPDKASSIWHLVAIDRETESGDADLQDLERRFRSFVGLAEGRPSIESGLDRLAFSEGMYSVQSAERLKGIDGLGARWQEAIATGGGRSRRAGNGCHGSTFRSRVAFPQYTEAPLFRGPSGCGCRLFSGAAGARREQQLVDVASLYIGHRRRRCAARFGSSAGSRGLDLAAASAAGGIASGNRHRAAQRALRGGDFGDAAA